MSTHDVPGAKIENDDALGAGCWAEHADGSLIFVLSSEGDRVVAEMFDMSEQPIVSYKFATPIKAFERRFSYPPTGTSDLVWTWHDKTPFPWDRIIKAGVRPRPRITDVEEEISAAKRVAKSLQLKARRIRQDEIEHRAAEVRTRGIRERIGRALAELRG